MESTEGWIQHWPTEGCGKIVVICRDELLAKSDPIATSIDIPPFTIAKTTDIISRTLDQECESEQEAQAISDISERLDGHPLAIDAVAKTVKFSRRFKSISEVLPYLEGTTLSVLKRPNPDVNNVWQGPFDGLSDDAAELLSLLCFLDPEPIPQSFFQQALRRRTLIKALSGEIVRGLLSSLHSTFKLTCRTHIDGNGRSKASKPSFSTPHLFRSTQRPASLQ